MARKILVIEDDKDIAHLLQLHLKDMGYEITLAFTGDVGLQKALSGSFDLIILDLMLPGIDGWEIAKTLRGQPTYTPLLMLTARSSEVDRVLGLEVGADDYMTKPFSIRELLARVKALFRRVEALKSPPLSGSHKIIRRGNLYIDSEKRKVTLAGNPVELTAKEFDLLIQFAERPGRVYTRSQLLDLVWGYGHDGYEHTVNSHINRLRAKIEDNPARPKMILTVWGVGYQFAESNEKEK